ncbi:MAG: 23S rRNA (adenine(2503)-C(2))-methyltransferase RlmN [Oscillospiraceae bacterium]|nr:23S rRNA (adenine(2503)-C(2))-methyltransferase RlmN [Oscillospiraceae bacterium]
MKKDILSLSFEELQGEISAIGAEKFRAGQIFDWLHVKKITAFSEITNISAQLRQKLTETFWLNALTIQKKLISKSDNTIKYLYKLHDGESVETVLMKYHHADSLCISTQVGCKMNCAFCASGANGFIRNLTPAEMLLQIYETERDNKNNASAGSTVGSLVLMGIGEPLDNFDNTVKFLQILSEKNGRNMSLRHVSLSTCGLADRIDELAELKLGLTLSISLHAADDETRSKIMPVNNAFNIERLIDSCKNYFEKTGRRISFEYALIKNVNDSVKDAEKLVKLIKPLHAHVNLIPFNYINTEKNKKSENIKEFQVYLTKAGINATIRRTLGSDINAACGQLRIASQNNNL